MNGPISDKKWLVDSWLGVFLFMAASLAGAENTESPRVIVASRLAQIEAAAGQMNMDGTLRLTYQLGASAELGQLGIRFELEHRIETDAVGKPYSGWRIKGFQSSLVPGERAHLVWQPLAGAAVKFERAKIGRALISSGLTPWLIRESAVGEHEIRSLSGQLWRYRQGILVFAEYPTLGGLRFDTQGTWITRIEKGDGPAGAPPLLEAAYDPSGRLVYWQIGTEKPQRFIWNETGQLKIWRRGDGSEVRFIYRDGLLSEITTPGSSPRRFTWGENPNYDQGASGWAAPVHLASDGDSEYRYDMSKKGFVVTRKELAGGAITTTVFNPRLHRLVQRAGGIDYTVFFRNGALGLAVDRVEMAGEIFEQYIYDEHDRLVGIRRRGEPERQLSYDETGRLMAFEVDP